MEYKVGSLADLISGTHNAETSNRSIAYVPIKTENITPGESSPKSSTTSGRKRRKAHWEEVIHPYEEIKIVNKFSVGDTEEEAEGDKDEEKLPIRPRKKKITLDVEKELRTIFVKNIPHTVSVKKLKQIFKSFGKIESIRLRCAARGDTRIPKKVTIIKKDFHPERTNICAFIRYHTKESVEEAVKANASLIIEDHHVFVDRAVKDRQHDQKKAIFLGNVPFGAEEDEIWNIFEKCGKIKDIRIVRDKETGFGKGIAFVNFMSSDAVELAMTLHGVKLRDNELRVQRFTKKLKDTSNSPRRKAFPSKKYPMKRTGHGNNWGSDKKYSWNNGVPHEEKTFSNNEHVNRNKGKKFKNNEVSDVEKMFPNTDHVHRNKRKRIQSNKQSEHTNLNKKIKEENFSVESKTQQNTPSKSFQGQKITDKKRKKKKINKNELKKKIIAKKLTGR